MTFDHMLTLGLHLLTAFGLLALATRELNPEIRTLPQIGAIFLTIAAIWAMINFVEALG